MEISDQVLYTKFRSGDNNSFDLIVNKYQKLVYKVAKETFERGNSDVHTQMMCGYMNLIEDVANEVWIRLLKCISEGIDFDDAHSMKKLIIILTVRYVKDLKRTSIRNRKRTIITNIEKGKRNNFFSSKDHMVNIDCVDKEALEKPDRLEEKITDETSFDEILLSLSDSLTEREIKLCEVIKNKMIMGERSNHAEIAAILGISERTLRNDLSRIKKLYFEKKEYI